MKKTTDIELELKIYKEIHNDDLTRIMKLERDLNYYKALAELYDDLFKDIVDSKNYKIIKKIKDERFKEDMKELGHWNYQI